MFARSCVRGLLLLCLGSSVVGCSNPSGLDSIQVTPATQSLTVGQTTQLTAVGTYGNAKRPSTQNVTTGVTWASSSPAVASVDASGLVTAIGPGTATVTASAAAFNGDTNASAAVTVTGSAVGGGGGSTGGVLVSLPNHSERYCGGQFARYRQFPGDRNILGRPIRQGPDKLPRDLALSDTQRFPCQHEHRGANPGATGRDCYCIRERNCRDNSGSNESK